MIRFCYTTFFIALVVSFCGMPQRTLARESCPESLRLELRNEQGKLLYSAPVHEGMFFAIRYTHSVAQSPVEDWFSVVDGSIELQRTEYHDFGAGLPHSPAPGQTMTVRDGRIIIDGYHLRLPQFDVRVGRVANHTLLLELATGRKVELPLATLIAPGQAITFCVQKGIG